MWYDRSMESADVERARQYRRRRDVQRHAQRESERLAWLERVCEAVRRIAPAHAGVRRVVVFGSLLRPGRFRPDSDVDLAVECDTLEAESAFWRALERALERDVDVRTLSGAVKAAAEGGGMEVYGRAYPGAEG